MKHVARLLSVAALAGTIVPAVLFFHDRVALPDVKTWMLVSAIVWFAATPIWMERS